MKKLVNVPKVFMPLLGHISSFAIKQCKAQFDRLKGDFDPTEPCSQTLMKGVGIPCAHRLAELLETDDGLTSADFHLQWHLKYNPELTATPNVKKNPKGRPSTKKPGYTSTTRDASAFEIVEANIEKKQRANATKLKDAQKASGESKHPVKPTKKRVNKTNVQLGRRPKQNEKNDQSKADEDHDEDKEGDDLPDLPEIGIAPSPGPIKGDQAEDGSTYGEEVDSAALLALLDEKMAVVPRHLQSMVKDVFHPHGDGHCGFQCVSRALGYDNDGSDGFLRVRQEMIAEIEGNRPTYLKLQGGEEEVSKIIKGLTMQPSETIVPPEKWLDKMSHGQIVANAYSRPIESADPGPLYLLHVNGNHWALPHVEGSVKPLAPPILATRSTTKAAKGWLAYIEQGVASYNTSSHKCHFTSR
ncbi:hypothetical protein Pst134EA_022772 [Puccinia striiformis f. sp. tritici]|uniref:hypothetical protein n=1 Tax=Puccinia striiformis f. sp. tritici TaxID=168172 RepID=UPI002007DC65|nr:hypothetical protein Pst134EA_022772 [Puccinia striiformis f. sp. tritici]KAH9455301.1 hypothetical protein Pst134EA_022772 [Puccinia striiformis f. sp. tritici]